jgi:hypothetical protein
VFSYMTVLPVSLFDPPFIPGCARKPGILGF